MKDFIKKRLRESLNSIIDEDYPLSFNMDDFKKLNSFNARIKYCEANLKRISSGSGRIVYKIDDIKVLKLAKNKKGLAQNEVEASYSNYHDIKDITAQVFSYDQNNLWIEMELALPVTKGIFKQIVGFSFDDYCTALYNYDNRDKPNGQRLNMAIDKDLVDSMWENEFIYDIFNFMGNYDIPSGDLRRLSTYGLVKRNGHEQIVLIDYGLNKDVYDSYYS